ncbi:MAG TPA: adenylyltransferase/cytidyltransferase family protein, partial [Clostridia bacterium]|nr:adenylyltransferase/cytidyltransferase family protein [Clostridia bacterium]
MGGTFDPIHYGHLVTAEGVRYQFELEKVIFIPTGKPPHKHRVVTNPIHRLAMTKIAIGSNDFFKVCDLEVKREGYSYTIETVREI